MWRWVKATNRMEEVAKKREQSDDSKRQGVTKSRCASLSG